MAKKVRHYQAQPVRKYFGIAKTDDEYEIEQIVYYKYSIIPREVEVKTGSGKIRKLFTLQFKAEKLIIKNDKIDDLILKIQGGGADLHFKRVDNPLDIPIKRPSLVVIELDNSIQWRFSNKRPSVTMKKENRGKNFNLIHVPDTANSTVPDNLNGKDCHLLYFSAVKRKYYDGLKIDHNKFNFHIDMYYIYKNEQNEEIVEIVPIILDPDITNPGGQGVPPHN